MPLSHQVDQFGRPVLPASVYSAIVAASDSSETGALTVAKVEDALKTLGGTFASVASVFAASSRRPSKLAKKAEPPPAPDIAETVRKLNRYIQTNLNKTGAIALNQPCSVVVKTRTGYKMAPHIGGESFCVSSAYLGKKGNLIFVFTPQTVNMREQYKFAEFGCAAALDKLTGFREWYDEAMNSIDQATAGVVRELAAAESTGDLETLRIKRAMEQPGYEEFGSW